MSTLLTKALDAIFSHPFGVIGVMQDHEKSLGARLVLLGQEKPFRFPVEDWQPSIVSILGSDVRIVAIQAKSPGSGAFRRLIDGIVHAGLVPVVIEPLEPTMPAILRRWGWTHKRRNRGFESFEEWRPRRVKPPRSQRSTP